MTNAASHLDAHLKEGLTRICRCWAVRRKDGVEMGFTDHDRSLVFDGIEFKADTGMSAKAVQQTPGLSVDNTEALGVLSDHGVRRVDIEAGRYDDAEVVAWLVRWEDVAQRKVLFRGTIGEITRFGGAFRAELRGLAERLNISQTRVYQRECTAILGDAGCRVDLSHPGYTIEAVIDALSNDGRKLYFADPGGFAERWFDKGSVEATNGAALGLTGVIKNDTQAEGRRCIEMWSAFGITPALGDTVRITAGCNKRADTCRQKFNNFLNFRGFPNIPGEDWLISYPHRDGVNDGGSMFR